MENPDNLERIEVLVIEDSGLIAMEIEAALRDVGIDAVRVDSVAAALDAVASRKFDCALLNFQLSDGTCAPVVSALAARDCPFAIVSGMESQHIEDAIGKYPFFRKPVEARQLADWVRQIVGLPG